ncbi:MAG: DUF1801 domain-containing protein, partial [Usitatibacteraceae bacterium]
MKKQSRDPGGSDDVNAFMRELDHPLKTEIEKVRELIRDADGAITEGIKWKAPSFAVGEYFATVNLRATDTVQVILHLGAKVRADITSRIAIDDPASLLQWLGKDRAS